VCVALRHGGGAVQLMLSSGRDVWCVVAMGASMVLLLMMVVLTW
jgi:hypothetical protein